MSLSKIDRGFLYADFIPQAIVELPVQEIQSRYDAWQTLSDDLDDFVGVAFSLNNDLCFTIKHYASNPKNMFTIYIQPRHMTYAEISNAVDEIVDSMKFPREVIRWKRTSENAENEDLKWTA